MGTRSTIALEYADGTVDQIYCHWDGYLDNNGQILLQHYMDPFKVRELMDLGDLSSLRPEIGFEHEFSQFESTLDSETFDKLYGNMCTFYTRDRGETTPARKFKDFADYKDNHQYEEYEYILRQVDGKAVWYVSYYKTVGEYVYVELETACYVENMMEVV